MIRPTPEQARAFQDYKVKGTESQKQSQESSITSSFIFDFLRFADEVAVGLRSGSSSHIGRYRFGDGSHQSHAVQIESVDQVPMGAQVTVYKTELMLQKKRETVVLGQEVTAAEISVGALTTLSNHRPNLLLPVEKVLQVYRGPANVLYAEPGNPLQPIVPSMTQEWDEMMNFVESIKNLEVAFKGDGPN